MFTVKWIRTDDKVRAEQLYPDVLSLSHTTKDSAARVTFDFAGGCQATIETGRIYVLNDAGRTVERYILPGDAEFPMA